MKINDVKHNHSLTDLLKILLFAILMLAPALSVATRCLYVVCNKNAYQSYSSATKIQLVNGDNTNALSGNTLYMSYSNEQGSYNYSQQFYFTWISVDLGDYTAAALDFDPDGIRTYSGGALQLHNPNSNTWSSYNGPNGAVIWGNTLTNFTITLKDTITNLFSGGNLRVQVMYQTQDKLDNVFEYSVSQLENDQLFSWTANTPVYTGVNAMCTQLGVTGQAIPIILSYWLILTCIYVIIDIVIKLFTLLTHMISRKAG